MRAFATNCFANRIDNENYMDVFLKFIKDYGTENAVRVFATNCFANRIDNFHYQLDWQNS